MARVLSAGGLAALDDLPPKLRDDPQMQAVQDVYAREAARAQARIEHLRAQFFPQTADETGMPMWEALLGLPIAPGDQTLEQRRGIVIETLRQLKGESTDARWVAAVDRLVGPGWTYTDHDPVDGLPPAYTRRVVLPFPADGGRFAVIKRLMRAFTDPHIDLQVVSATGFLLDRSQMDQETLG